jgi:APA family basic amino acid/polyamine antiporter
MRNPTSGTLLRVLGLGFGIAVLIGNTIGSGILRVPGEVAGHLPSTGWFLAVWIAGGVYALLGSNALAEVAAMTAESGGYTVFVRRGLGPFFGFVAGWSDWLSTCTSTTAACIFLGEAVAKLTGLGAGAVSLIGCALLLAFVVLQWSGVRSASGTQSLTTILKAVALLAFVGICFAYSGSANVDSVAVERSGSLFVAVILSIQAVIFTYDGWIGPAYFAGELRDPGRELPRSIFTGVLAVIVIYLGINLAILHVVPIQKLAGDPFAAGSAMAAIFGGRGDAVLRLLVIGFLLSAINAYLMMTSRIFYALSAANGYARGARVNHGGTPTVGLLVSALAAALFLLSGTYARVIAITAFLFVANYTFTFLSLFALRLREPNTPRPYRAWGHPWTTGFVLLVSVALLVGALVADTWNSLASIALLLLSYPVFRLITKRNSRAA